MARKKSKAPSGFVSASEYTKKYSGDNQTANSGKRTSSNGFISAEDWENNYKGRETNFNKLYNDDFVTNGWIRFAKNQTNQTNQTQQRQTVTTPKYYYDRPVYDFNNRGKGTSGGGGGNGNNSKIGTSKLIASGGVSDMPSGKKSENLWDNIKNPRIRERQAFPKFMTERPEDYNDHDEDYDREIYDFYYGKGEYDKIGRSGNRNSILQRNSDIKDLWNDFDNGTVAEIAKTLQPKTKPEEENKTPDKDEGYYGKGNIDLSNRQGVKNPDGSISTVRSITVGYDDGTYVLPTVINGRVVSDEEAIKHFEQTGEYLGRFKTQEEADYYAEKLHNKEAIRTGGAVEIGGSEREMTPYEMYESTDPKLRGQMAKLLLKYDNFQDYINDHPFESKEDLERDRAAWDAIHETATEWLEEQEKIGATTVPEWNQDENSQVYTNLIHDIPLFADNPERNEQTDRMLYDYMYGEDGWYDINKNNPDFKAELDAMWKPLQSGEMETIAKEKQNYENFIKEWGYQSAMIRQSEKEMKLIDHQEKLIDKYGKYIAGYGDVKLTGDNYIPEYDKGGGQIYGLSTESAGGTSNIDRIYSLVSGGKELAYWAAQQGDNPQITNDYRYAMMMLNGENGNYDEIGKFCELYLDDVKNGREPTQAANFLNGLKPYLENRYSEAEKIGFSEFARKYPVVASGLSLAARQANTYMDVVRHIASGLGDPEVQNIDSVYYIFSRYADQVEGTIANDIGGFGAKIYTNVMNTASNLLRGLATSGIGETSHLAQTALSLGGMFLQVDQEATARYLQQYDYETASKYAAVDGLFEVLQEFLPFETMLGSEGKSFFKALRNNVLSEVGQEFSGASWFKPLEWLFKGENENKARADEIIARRGYEDSNGEWKDLSYLADDHEALVETANLQANHEYWTEAIESGLAGAFGGAVSSTYGPIAQAIGTSKTGRNINAKANTEGGKTGGQQLMEAALTMGENTESYQLAKGMEESGEISNRKTGELAQAIIEESGEKIGEVARDTVERIAKETMTQNGMDKAEATRIAPIMTKAIIDGGKSLTQVEMTALARNDAAMQTYKSFLTETGSAALETAARIATMPQQAIRQRAIGLATGTAKASLKGATAEGIAESIGKVTLATTEEIRKANGREAGNGLDVITDGKIAEITGKDGNELILSDGTTADIGDVKATGDAAGILLQYAQTNGNIIGDKGFGAILESISANTKQKGAKVVNDSLNVYLSGRIGLGIAESGLTAKSAQYIWQAAQEDQQAANRERTNTNQQKAKAGQGTATLNGAEYGTEEFSQALKTLPVSRETRTDAVATAEIAKRMGLTVNYIYDAARSDIFGWEDRDTGHVTINLAGKNANGTSRSLLTVAGHEFTHWLEQNSGEAYNQLRKFVFDRLEKSGVNVAQRVMDTIRDYRIVAEQELDLEGAMAEIVANSCDQVLTNEKVIAELNKTNPTLAGKVRQFVKNFTGLLRAAAKNIAGSDSVESRALKNYAEEIAEKWLGAKAEATEDRERIAKEAGFDQEGMLSYSMAGAMAGGAIGAAVRKAQQMAKRGISDEEIYKQTGAMPGYSGNYWIVLDNQGIRMKEGISGGWKGTKSLGQLMNADALFKAYPQLQDLEVETQAMKRAYGKYDQDANRITLDTGMFRDNPEMVERTVRHEVQHAIQVIEGRNAGATMYSWKRVMDELNAWDREGINPLSLYERTVGEIEAREASKDEGRGMPTKDQYKNALAIEDYIDENGNVRKDAKLSVQQMDEAYQAAIDSGDMELAQQLVEMAAKKAGYTMKVYHGTPTGGFTQFRNWSYFTENKKYADRYQNASASGIRGRYEETNKQTYELYMNPGKVFDTRKAKEARLYNEARTEYGLGALTETDSGLPDWTNGRDLVEFIEDRELDYDTIMLDEGADGGYGEDVVKRGISYMTRSNLVKSAETVTYDDNGNVIPLSERFNKKQQDIRYSVKQLDEEYAEAVENGDWRKAEDMLLEKMQRTEGVTGYRAPYFYAGEHKDIARLIKSGNQEIISSIVNDMAQHVPDNAVLVPMPPHEGKVTDTTDTYILAQALSEVTGAPVINALESDYHESRYKAKAAGNRNVNAQTMGFRQVEEIPEGMMPVFIDNMVGGGQTAMAAKNAIGRGITLAYAQSSRAKSQGVKAVSVTYDKDGKLIPISQRMDPNNKSWKFSMRMPVEERADGLIAVHNMTWENLWDTLNEGGFTAPSIAIIKARMGHTKYGEISVVFKPSAIDPQQNRLNKIYGEDAYTPTRYNADVETELIYENINKAADELAGLVEGLDEDLYNEVNRWFSKRSYRGITNKTPEAMAEEGYNNEALMAAFLRSQGKEVPIKTRERYTSLNIKENRIDTYIEIMKLLARNGVYNQFIEDVEHLSGRKLIEKYMDIIAPADETLQKHRDLWKEKEFDLSGKALMNWMKQVHDYAAGGSEKVTEPDWYETKNAMWGMIDKKEFVSWIAEKLRPAFGQKGIRNNLDPFTYSGERRTFKQLHMPYTIENVVKAMYKNAEEKGQGGRYAKGVVATASKEYKTLDDVRADSDRLRMMDEKEYQKLFDDLDERIKELAEEILPDDAYTFDYALMQAGRAYARSQTLEAIRRGLAAEGVTATREQLSKIKGLLDDAREIPTGYFEAKPMRVNDFSEIEKVIVPENAGDMMTDKLDQYGIPWEKYDGSDEDRLRVLNAQTSAQFSVQQPDMEVSRFMLGLNENSLATFQERSMLKQFKGINTSMEVVRHAMRERQKAIANIEAKGDKMSAYDRHELIRLRNLLKNSQDKLDRYKGQLAKVTSDKGYAKLMMRQQRLMTDMVQGRTLDDVRRTVDAMERNLQNIQSEMDQRAEKLKELAEKQGVLLIRTQLRNSGIRKIAANLKAKLGTALGVETIENRLAEIALKMQGGKSFGTDVEELAGMITGKMRGEYEGQAINTLRGSTVVLSKSQLAELKGQNRTIREVQQELAGTGIRVTGKGAGTLDMEWDELCDQIPALDRSATDKDMLDDLLNVIRGEKRASMEAQRLGMTDIQAGEMVIEAAAELMPQITKDPQSMKMIREVMDYIREVSGEAGESAKAMTDLNSALDRIRKEGKAAESAIRAADNRMADAIEYFNMLGEQSEAAQWKQERFALIGQLKDENTQNLLREQEKWKAKIAEDKEIRTQMENNRKEIRKINTVMKRMFRKLEAPKGMDNIPEYMRGLARVVSEIVVGNELTGKVRLTDGTQESLANKWRTLQAWTAQEGTADLSGLDEAEEAVALTMNQDVSMIQEGIDRINGIGFRYAKMDTVKELGEALKQVQEAISEIWGAIRAENEVQVNRRKTSVADAAYDVVQAAKGKKYREWTGKPGGAIRTLHSAIVSGNMTPEYFFRMIANKGLSALWENYHDAENRNGLLLAASKERMAQIAEEHGYDTWDTKQKIELRLEGGKTTVTLGQLMSLYATWKREKTLGPQMSYHLTKGGFYAEQDLRNEKFGRTEMDKRSHRVTESDAKLIESLLTEEQRKYVDDVVGYMSRDMSEIGNEASMAAYGIKLYKENYYFPFQMWDGVKNRKSNDAGSAAAAQDRAFHPSFAKSRVHGANNALVIGDFTQTATDHIAGMINYATMGLANESLQKVLNAKMYDNVDEEGFSGTVRNVQTILEERYGMEAMQYLKNLQMQLNGGAVRTQRTVFDKAISLFRKNAVAGSLSVALQQPLSYIRAAMMIPTKYLAKGLASEYWKGSYKELMAHSGVAVIKDMGRFDMNAGQTAREYLTPKGKQSTGRKIWEGVKEYSMILPEKMDAWTWTRMWVAVKAEQHELHLDMDMKSNEFLDLCGERFNDVMRRTQVYDSVLVRSANMRSDNTAMKSITSFMAEPTLTLNVLADAVRSAKEGEKGGKTLLAKAGATFLLSAALQAVVKSLFSTGRTPDEKKTLEENFWYRFWSNLINEADPVQLVPGYNDLITIIKKGELKDDAMGVVGKLFTAADNMLKLMNGDDERTVYRYLEDSAGQMTQLVSGLPLKNIMRDMRAMYNWFIGRPYADRETSGAVLNKQAEEAFWNADNLLGAINTKLGEAGFKTTNKAYYGRMFDAMQSGNQAEADEIREYMTLAKGADEKKIESGLKTAAKDRLDTVEANEWMIENDMMNSTSTLTTQYKKGEISKEEYKKLLKKANPKMTDNDIWWSIDRIEYQKETGAEKAPASNSYYYRLTDAINSNSAEKIRSAVNDLVKHGISKDKVKDKLSDWKKEYLEGNSEKRRKLRDAMQKAYKILGYTAEDANKTIDKWEKDAKKKKK